MKIKVLNTSVSHFQFYPGRIFEHTRNCSFVQMSSNSYFVFMFILLWREDIYSLLVKVQLFGTKWKPGSLHLHCVEEEEGGFVRVCVCAVFRTKQCSSLYFVNQMEAWTALSGRKEHWASIKMKKNPAFLKHISQRKDFRREHAISLRSVFCYYQ